ncbi:MAG TPA: TolC family outer membrane protein [Dongiaceae bacterium]|nr:TolC family outer membrane protein [Dongiaceae bacterium]
MKKFPVKKALVLALALVSAPAVQAEVVTLKRTYELAQKNDPQWSAIRNQYEASRQQLDQSRAGLLPQVNLRGDYSHNDLDAEGVGTDSYASDGYTASVVQPLFRLENWHTWQRGKALDSQYVADFQTNQESFYLRVVTLYFDVLRTKANLSFRKSEEQAISRQLEQSKQRFDVGLVAITDVHEAQAAYDTAVSARISAEAELFVSLRALETLTGEHIDDVADLNETLPIVPPQPQDMNQWVETSLENNAGLHSAHQAALAAEEDYKVKRAGHAPTLDLVGSHNNQSTGAPASYTTPGIDTPDTTTNTIALQLEIPIYSGGLTSARQRESKYQSLAATDNEHLTRRQVIQDATNYYQLVVTNVAQVNARKQSSLSAQVALDATQAGYEAGTRTIVDVLTVQRNLFQAQRDYINARFDYVQNSLRLKQVAGRLTEQELLALEQWVKAP